MGETTAFSVFLHFHMEKLPAELLVPDPGLITEDYYIFYDP